MKIIIISNPIEIPKEHETINVLLEQGLECFHLRKPGCSKSDLELFLKKINPKFYRKIALHSHYELIQKYNIGGIHLTEQSRKSQVVLDACKAANQKGINVSCSFHVNSDIHGLKNFDYLLVSPVFDSISKEGYMAIDNLKLKDTLHQLRTNGRYDIIALGGVEENKAEKIMNMGFDGMALLGAIWQNPDQAIEKFSNIRSRVQQLQRV